MTNPKPGDLAIFVRAEDVEEKCKHERLIRIKNGWSVCPQCHGSGTRKVTLEGWVRLVEDVSQTSIGSTIYVVFIMAPSSHKKHFDVWKFQSDTSFSDARKRAIEDITQALRDNKCPDEIRQQLEVVDS